MSTSTSLLVKHIAYELHHGNLDLVRNALPHITGLSSELVQKINSMPKENLPKSASEIYAFPVTKVTKSSHPLETNVDIVAKILSYLRPGCDGAKHDKFQMANRRNDYSVHTSELWAAARVNSLFKEQVSFAYLDIIREKLGSKKVNSRELDGLRLQLGFPNLSTLMSLFPKECSQIEEFDFPDFTIVENFWSFSQLCPQVQRVHFAEPISHQVESFVKFAPRLRSLIIVNGRFIKDEALQIIVESCPHLEHIEFAGFEQVTTAGVILFAQHVPHLKKLALRGNWVREDLLIPLNCPKLTHLSLWGSSMTDAGLSALVRGCPKLQSLELQGCYGMTSAGLQQVAARLNQLTMINFQVCEELTDAVVEEFAQNCPHLQQVTMHYCGEITDRSLLALAKYCKDLKKLDVGKCEEITDEGIVAIAERCSQLTSINLEGCIKLTDGAFKAVISHCPSITQINLDNCHVSDAVIIALSEAYPRLEYIWATKLGDQAIFALILNCPALKGLFTPLTHSGLIAAHIGLPKGVCLRLDEFFYSRLKMWVDHPAKTSLGKLYQSLLKKEPVSKIEAFVSSHPELHCYSKVPSDKYSLRLYIQIATDMSQIFKPNWKNPVELADDLAELRTKETQSVKKQKT